MSPIKPFFLFLILKLEESCTVSRYSTAQIFFVTFQLKYQRYSIGIVIKLSRLITMHYMDLMVMFN